MAITDILEQRAMTDGEIQDILKFLDTTRHLAFEAYVKEHYKRSRHDLSWAERKKRIQLESNKLEIIK